MSIRLEPFENNKIYHVFNKSIDDRFVFDNDTDCNRFISLMEYYRSSETKFSYSRLSLLDPIIASSYLKKIHYANLFRIEIICYCLMPTHYHFLIKQKKNKGISQFMADIINSFTRYSNIKVERKGPIFLPDFKSVMITNEAQFMHVSRYIHLNPYSSGLIKTFNELVRYPWSSFNDYVYSNRNKLVQQKDLLSLFGNNKTRYKNFVLSNAEHQKTLEVVKYIKE